MAVVVVLIDISRRKVAEAVPKRAFSIRRIAYVWLIRTVKGTNT